MSREKFTSLSYIKVPILSKVRDELSKFEEIPSSFFVFKKNLRK